jgi:uncharacterized protein (TIGR03790 family)
MRRGAFQFIFFLTLLTFAPAAPALTPDEIALVVNDNVPESRQLAEFYSQARNVPADRIIALDLPDGEEIPFDIYERQVTPQVRQFLRSRELEQKVRCLVTFYGVPLRIADRVGTPRDNNEVARLTASLRQLANQLTKIATDIERRAAEIDHTFKPPSTDRTVEALAQRLQRAMQRVEVESQQTGDPKRRQELNDYLSESVQKLMAEAPGQDVMPASAPVPASMPAAALAELGEKPFDPEAREIVRRQARRGAGLIGYARLLQGHIDYLATKETGAAFDSELALLWWPTYARARWQPNALNAHFKALRSPPVVMVLRLDAPAPQMVRDLIAASIRVEREGLSGKLVVDSRGIHTPDGFGAFDQRLRTLATRVQTRTDVPVILDEKPEVLPANSVDDVALYCGWYSVHTYVPGMKLNPGAVGYHVASFELVSLRNIARHGWVRGLLESGAVSSVGPVAEPYLHSFPAPDEFFPLLLTGTKTLAEVYWTTVPMASWMQTCIGDPLYSPYRKTPRFGVEDLPAVLRTPEPATQSRAPQGRGVLPQAPQP